MVADEERSHLSEKQKDARAGCDEIGGIGKPIFDASRKREAVVDTFVNYGAAVMMAISKYADEFVRNNSEVYAAAPPAGDQRVLARNKRLKT